MTKKINADDLQIKISNFLADVVPVQGVGVVVLLMTDNFIRTTTNLSERDLKRALIEAFFWECEDGQEVDPIH